MKGLHVSLSCVYVCVHVCVCTFVQVQTWTRCSPRRIWSLHSGVWCIPGVSWAEVGAS